MIEPEIGLFENTPAINRGAQQANLDQNREITVIELFPDSLQDDCCIDMQACVKIALVAATLMVCIVFAPVTLGLFFVFCTIDALCETEILNKIAQFVDRFLSAPEFCPIEHESLEMAALEMAVRPQIRITPPLAQEQILQADSECQKDFKRFKNSLTDSTRIAISPAKLVGFNQLLQPYLDRNIPNLTNYLRNLPNDLFDTQESRTLKEYVIASIPGDISDEAENSPTFETARLIRIIFNIFAKYKDHVDQATDGQEELNTQYKRDFIRTLDHIKMTIDSGCVYNRATNLRAEIESTLNLQPFLVPAQVPVMDFSFALLMLKLQNHIIDQQIININAGCDLLNEANGNRAVLNEEVMVKWHVMSRLGLINDVGYTPGYYEGHVQNVIRGYQNEFKPIQFLFEQLTESTSESRLTNRFHTLIWQWFENEGFDLMDEESVEDRRLLLDLHNTSGFTPCFNAYAIAYFLTKNQFALCS
ncbi:MAG: hypothetical protein FJZ56_04825 [Chlamydiae bacterium]|nr:hypothetical protein [Chlamydiota bacterium]